MGIPKMFRFLSDRYPLIMQRLDEDHIFDHFYLDMNGIIHQCTHPNDDEIAIEDIDEMFARIFNYTERLYRIVAPRSLMFLAVDGVAPRAKMNQQRSRRFRSAKEAERALSESIERGDEIPDGVPFDSNCITPGTQFMYDLSKRFQRWIHSKMSTDYAWQQGCTVVFSGPEVPGEGEHKIMDHIRDWKKSDKYSPETRHCMYGLDADLMMLGLVAHTPHFTLIREKMKFSKSGRTVPKMRGTDSDADEFHLLEIAMLRDMLFLEFKRTDIIDPFERPADGMRKRPPSKFERKAILTTFAADLKEGPGKKNTPKRPNFKVDAHRIVDDFVFMCMLVGNDFLPNIPHLDIAEGGINLMFRVYKEMLPEWGGYLTHRHKLHPDRLESFMQRLALSEPQYFEHRAFTDNIEAYKTPEYRREYYLQKLGFDVDGEEGEEQLMRLRRIYLEGLHWVLQYYHNGVSSWSWFYSDFYAILASDMKQLRPIKVRFQKGRPFSPLTQLMAVLPPESAQFLPIPMQKLMIEPNSPVSDFYPADFETDMNGKRNPWEAIVMVPFIDEKRLLTQVANIDMEMELSEMEKKRNQLGPEIWFRANNYPRSDVKITPVRPSKYYMPYSSRSRSTSPSSSRSASRSPSPSRTSQARTSSSSSRLQSTRANSNRRTSPTRSSQGPKAIRGKENGNKPQTRRGQNMQGPPKRGPSQADDRGAAQGLPDAPTD